MPVELSARGGARQHCEAMFREQRQSGRSISQFCAIQRVSTSSFFRWKRILADESAKRMRRRSVRVDEAATFVPNLARFCLSPATTISDATIRRETRPIGVRLTPTAAKLCRPPTWRANFRPLRRTRPSPENSQCCCNACSASQCGTMEIQKVQKRSQCRKCLTHPLFSLTFFVNMAHPKLGYGMSENHA